MLRVATGLCVALLMCQSAFADGMTYPTYRYYHRYYLPPERHVIEVVQPPYSGIFIINGIRFTGMTSACLGWAAGERIRLMRDLVECRVKPYYLHHGDLAPGTGHWRTEIAHGQVWCALCTDGSPDFASPLMCLTFPAVTGIRRSDRVI